MVEVNGHGPKDPSKLETNISMTYCVWCLQTKVCCMNIQYFVICYDS